MPGLLQKLIKAVIHPSGEKPDAHEAGLQQELQSWAEMISRYFYYFNELNPAEKQRFLHRVYAFRQKKIFHYIGLEENKEIPVLISAAAVQISFGLRKYRMSFFRDIYVMADAYTYGEGEEPWAGHVNRKGIYISWKHFIHGYAVNHDRDNVGLHEMAHALEYEYFLGKGGSDDNFTKHFLGYKKLAEKTLPRLARNSGGLLSEKANEDFHECWAECVELFFENPSDLNREFPQFYDSIRELLNQDPLNNIKILRPGLAE